MKNIVILTGAGISAESGIKTFRDAFGLWENHAIEDVASPEGFKRNPELVYEFYNARREQLNSPEVLPNKGHFALTRLINEFIGEATLITQNVDNLHELSGLAPEKVWHMHGELQKMRCQKSQEIFEAPITFNGLTKCPCCAEAGNLRPHIVWFGEMPFYLEEAFEKLSNCDLFLSIGTSGLVYPAAQFVAMTPSHCKKIEVNLNETQVSREFDECRVGPAGVVLPQLIAEILAD